MARSKSSCLHTRITLGHYMRTSTSFRLPILYPQRVSKTTVIYNQCSTARQRFISTGVTARRGFVDILKKATLGKPRASNKIPSRAIKNPRGTHHQAPADRDKIFGG